ncbi:hypothetical protein CD36_01830 [Candida dubliniensis CD36]|uniref:Uncharacterized protein n=1 Tax=Candida dubliniensis (strain CD36 / ATCC MYA-646 / CBS 7987 / NCPF 3949 / NRRL Y-17841) TaxID=573826 RepID=B9W6Y5_CANDC|nr:hypothetical protein CD36_01830 [Candida dubliniensis CD36]CAX44443.1 hypothetical protein CD36_01830 [Candida dubliniensis CD36]
MCYSFLYCIRIFLFHIQCIFQSTLTPRKCAFRIILQLVIFPIHRFKYLLQLFARIGKSLGLGATTLKVGKVQLRHEKFFLAILDCYVKLNNLMKLFDHDFCFNDSNFIVQG